MKHNQNILHKRFGRLVVVKVDFRDTMGNVYWICECDCGTMKSIRFRNLVDERTKSCGCLKEELNKQQRLTHGRSHSKEYHAWNNMKVRCHKPKNKHYHNYGGRGITICDRWQSFENFLSDVGLSPTKEHTLERIDVNGNYEPSNCTWATRQEQADNRRNTIKVTINGQKKTVREWSYASGISMYTIRSRMRRGIPSEQLIIRGRET